MGSFRAACCFAPWVRSEATVYRYRTVCWRTVVCNAKRYIWLGPSKSLCATSPHSTARKRFNPAFTRWVLFCRAGLVWYLLQPSERTACSNTVDLPPFGPGSILAGTRQKSAAIGFVCGAFRCRSSDMGPAEEAQTPPITVEKRYMVGETSSQDQRHLEKSSINTVCYEYFLSLAQVLLWMPNDQHAVKCWAYLRV